jgi:hypothetical protein
MRNLTSLVESNAFWSWITDQMSNKQEHRHVVESIRRFRNQSCQGKFLRRNLHNKARYFVTEAAASEINTGRISSPTGKRGGFEAGDDAGLNPTRVATGILFLNK